MNIWYCAALALGGSDPLSELPLPPPVLEAKPAQIPIAHDEKPCADCGGTVKPRPPVAHQTIPSMPTPEQWTPRATVVGSSGPVAVELPQRAATPSRQSAWPARQYEAAQQYPSQQYTASTSMVQKTPWWKRLFNGSRQTMPSMTQSYAEPTPMNGQMTASMPPTAGHILRREAWRTQQLTPTSPVDSQMAAMLTTPSQTSAPAMATMPMPQEQLQTAAKQTHTVRKPTPTTTSMLRDPSVWSYSAPRTSTPPTYSQKDAETPSPKTATPTMIELPDMPPQAPAPATAPLPSWTDEVIAKTIEHNAKAAPIAGATTKASAVPATKVESLTISGRVSKSDAAGSGWVLKTEDGREYSLKGDDDLLRCRHGDQVEVTGVVTPPVGVNSIQVEKVSFSAKR
jgi:hypothetical protein